MFLNQTEEIRRQGRHTKPWIPYPESQSPTTEQPILISNRSGHKVLLACSRRSTCQSWDFPLQCAPYEHCRCTICTTYILQVHHIRLQVYLAYLHIYIYICIYVYTYMHIYMYAYIYMCIYSLTITSYIDKYTIYVLQERGSNSWTGWRSSTWQSGRASIRCRWPLLPCSWRFKPCHVIALIWTHKSSIFGERQYKLRIGATRTDTNFIAGCCHPANGGTSLLN